MIQQFNPVSGTNYSGRNLVELAILAEKKGYKSNKWITFLQAQQLKRRIKRGEKSAAVFRGYGEDAKKDDKTGKTITYTYPLGFARVFNLDQTIKA